MDSNSRPAATKDSNSIETINTNKEEMLDYFMTCISSTRSGDIISPNTIIDFPRTEGGIIQNGICKSELGRS